MRRDETYLLDILIAARRAMSYMEGITREKFQRNEMLQDNELLHSGNKGIHGSSILSSQTLTG